MSNRIVLAFMLLVLLWASEVRSICKDPGSAGDPLLDSLSEPLDEAGLDYRRRWSGLVEPDPMRPQLARLSGYPVGSKPFLDASWQHGFEAAVHSEGSLMAIPRGATGLSPAEFISAWHDAPLHKRVFVSFTRADQVYANTVRGLLEANGYAVFTYLAESETPPFSPEAVGQMFRTAGHHLVIDTPSARQSFGVTLEAHSLRAVEAKARIAAQPKPSTAESRSIPTTREVRGVGEGPRQRPAIGGETILDKFRYVPRDTPGCVECACDGVPIGCIPKFACQGPC